MIAQINIVKKSFADKQLYSGLEFTVQAREKIGLIGRNGCGKSTLFHILSGEDTDFDGQASIKSGRQLIASRQEHEAFLDQTVLGYIAGDLPEFTSLQKIVETFPATMGDNPGKLQQYSDALERFSGLGYFDLENQIAKILADYQLTIDIAKTRLGQLSGGQKRMVELAKIQLAKGDLALIDEPTNHMDYVAKASFIGWLKQASEAVLVITHDRGVLSSVDRIIEIRDGKALSFNGNYDAYLRANTLSIVSNLNEFEVEQRRIARLQADVIRFRRLKEKARKPETIRQFKIREERAGRELAALSTKDKPSFWMDQESTQALNSKVVDSYQKHKAQTIRVRTQRKDHRGQRLLTVEGLSLGYEQPLFSSVQFELAQGELIELRGRNGAGKTTLVQTILQIAAGSALTARVFCGLIEPASPLLIGVYEQEINRRLLELPLAVAVEQAYQAKQLPVTDQLIKQLLSDYLFNPHTDAQTPLKTLSGGQKARYQLMSMLAGQPQMLILDEPTNHLDLPSIEELENALKQYSGAVLYISHDEYFTKNVGGRVLEIA